MNYLIYTDSASNLTDEILRELDIRMISYSCSINGEETGCYEQGRDDAAFAGHFYNSMREGADVKTSLINMQNLIDRFSEPMSRGLDVLFIGMSSGVTGTMRSARLAAEELESMFPGRRCVVADPLTASLGEGMMVMQAARMRLDECVAYVENDRMKLMSVFTVDDLHYLKNGGRISSTAYIAGTLLNIKPILRATDDGKISMCGKVRGRRKALDTLVDCFLSKAVEPNSQTIYIAHGDCEADALYVRDEIARCIPIKGAVIKYYDVCTGCHVGPGTVALFFMSESRDYAPSQVLVPRAGLAARM